METEPRLVAIGKAIKMRREEAVPRRSQEDMAHAAGISLRNWQKLEAGTENPTIRTLLRVSDAFGARLADMLSEIPSIAERPKGSKRTHSNRT